jgi:hypothetical protein
LINQMLDLDYTFLDNFLRDFYPVSLFPTLVCAAVPGTRMERVLMEFFYRELAQGEQEWANRQLALPIINLLDLEPCPLVTPLEEWFTTNLPITLVISSALRIAPCMESLSSMRGGLLNDATMEQFSHSRISHLRLGQQQLTDEGLALSFTRMSETLQILELNDVTNASDSTFAALGKFVSLQRLELQSMSNLQDKHLVDIFGGSVSLSLLHLVLCSCYSITDPTPIAHCSKLTFLHLQACEFTNVRT